MSALHRGAILRFDGVIRAALEAAALVHGTAPFGVCLVDLGGEHGRRFAAALHEASPHGPHPESLASLRAGLWWCRSVSLPVLAREVTATFGAELGAAVEAVGVARAVPVVHVGDGLAMVAAFTAPVPPS